MNTLRTLRITAGALTALGLAAASTSALAEQGTAGQANTQATPPTESQTTPNPDPRAASSPHQRDVTGQAGEKGAEEAPPTANPDASGATTPHQRDAVTGGAQKSAGANERAAGKDKEMTGDTKPKDKLVGLPVESSDGTQLGSVVDIVRDNAGMPTYAVIAIDNDTTAVPYETAMSMMKGGKVVMSQTRLASAPRVKQSEWLDETSSKWRSESDRYWSSGVRTAEPGNMPKPKDR